MTNFELTKDMAYVIGFIIGDGNISQSYIVRAVEENENFIKGFAETFFLAFGRMPKIYFDKYNNSFVAYVHSKEIWNYLANVMEIPKGTKSQIVRIPDEVKHSNEEIKCALISGLFDAEGSVIKMKDPIHHPKGYLKIQFKVHNKDLARDVYDILFMLKRRFPFNKEVLTANKIEYPPKDAILECLARLPEKELTSLANQVRPFLFKEDDIELVLKATLYAERFLREYE